MGQHHGAIQRQTKGKAKMANRVTVQDLAVSFFCNGVNGVANDVIARKDPAGAIADLVDYLQANKPGLDVQPLRELQARFFVSKGARGRGPLRDGETRSYKAQEVNGSVFLRLPLDMVGACKGDEINVTLDGNTLTVRV